MLRRVVVSWAAGATRLWRDLHSLEAALYGSVKALLHDELVFVLPRRNGAVDMRTCTAACNGIQLPCLRDLGRFRTREASPRLRNPATHDENVLRCEEE